MHGEGQQCRRRDGESFEVLPNQGMGVEHVPGVAGAVEEGILNVEEAEDVLAGEAAEDRPLPVDGAAAAAGEALEVPRGEITMLDEGGQGLVVIEKLLGTG